MNQNEYHPVLVFTDGAARGNPGNGGYGVVVINREANQVYEMGQAKDPTTNNEMELAAVVAALQYLAGEDVRQATIFTDSKYVFQGVTGWRFGWARNGWKTKEGEPVKNLELWQRAHQLLTTAGFIDIDWVHLPGHMNIHGNERADAIATAYADSADPGLVQGRPNAADWQAYNAAIPSKKEIEENRARKRAHKSGEGCWYLSLVDGELVEHQTWNECKEHVAGKKASFKKVCSEEEKEEILERWGQ